MVKALTKSEFLATVAQTKYGKKTPQEKEEEQKSDIKDKENLKFNKFTVLSIKKLSDKVDLLSAVAERNNILITSLYNDIGYFKTQRRIDPNSTSFTSIRFAIRSKTIKGQIDKINEELTKIRSIKVKTMTTGTKKKTKKQLAEEDTKSTGLFETLASNPLLLAAALGGLPRAIALSRLLIKGLAITLAPAAISRTASRLTGEPGIPGDPMAEQFSQDIDKVLLTVGAYQLGKTAFTLSSAIKQKYQKSERGKIASRNARIKSVNSNIKRFRAEGYSFREAQKLAGKRVASAGKVTQNLKKMKILSRVINGVVKRLPAVAAADVALRLARMAELQIDESNGTISYLEYKKGMINNYGHLISTIGITGFSTAAGALAGTGLFPGLGTAAGAAIGLGIGTIASLAIDEEGKSIEWMAEKMFMLIHEDKSLSKPESSTTLNDREAGAGGSGSGAGGSTSVGSTPDLSSLISRGESEAAGGYRAYNQRLPGGKFVAGQANFQELTLDEIIRGQERGQFFAVGKYQIIPKTMIEAKKVMGLTGSEIFTPELQERIFSEFLIGSKRPAIRDYITGKSDDLEEAATKLAQEFSSVSIRDDRLVSYYKKDKASISRLEVKNVLQVERERYLAGRSVSDQVRVADASANAATVADASANAATPNQVRVADAPPVPPLEPASVVTPLTAKNEVIDEENSFDMEATINSQAALIAATRNQNQINNVTTEVIKMQRNASTEFPHVINTSFNA
jgi:hypothetical protein